VRELRNVIERVMILEDGDLITTTYLPRGLGKEGGDFARAATASPSVTHHSIHSEQSAAHEPHASSSNFQLPPEGVVLDDVEMSLVRQALQRSNGNQTRAAELLGISRDQLRYRLKKLDEATQE
jgi:DNA-binding NtrC family response regulator